MPLKSELLLSVSRSNLPYFFFELSASRKLHETARWGSQIIQNPPDRYNIDVGLLPFLRKNTQVMD
jgi:hypothetical protein